jgi:hypothetical protein
MFVLILLLLILSLISNVYPAGYLMLTEVMFHPDGLSATDNQFIELKNVGDATFSFAGVAITKGTL